ncbi:MAG TPA: gamma-glutamyl-gamma-aminobutyrate hydrolase family protein [Bacillota bacterium]|nr:gamma-glutamyl-gamma-aminobutyrate hydrolase family protein [Bacillota bacterium]
MKPVIGITSSMEVDETYYMTAIDNVKAVEKAGGLSLILPYWQEDRDIGRMVKMLDGLYMTGGYDINPTLFGEEPHRQLGTIIPSRDAFEIELVKQMLKENKPILAVCRGCQVLNIAAGGDMYQDIYAQNEQELLQHTQRAPKGHGSHFVDVLKGSLLSQLTGVEKLLVNSRHHQANRNVVEPLKVSGKATDGIIEAIESKDHSFVLGLQWHPENMAMANDEVSRAIFRGFIQACQQDE